MEVPQKEQAEVALVRVVTVAKDCLALELIIIVVQFCLYVIEPCIELIVFLFLRFIKIIVRQKTYPF